jgi:NADH-quinone oxidoreductase subunit M
MVLGAAYMLRFGRAILYGVTAPDVSLKDLSLREGIGFIPLLAMILWIGLNPASIMDKVNPAVTQLTTARAAAGAPQQPAPHATPPVTPTTPGNGGANNGH